MLLLVNLSVTKWCKKNWNMYQTLTHGYSFESTKLVHPESVYRFSLTLMLLVGNLAVTNWLIKQKCDWNPGTWVLIWEYLKVHDSVYRWFKNLFVLVANLAVTKWCKKLKNEWNPDTVGLITFLHSGLLMLVSYKMQSCSQESFNAIFQKC